MSRRRVVGPAAVARLAGAALALAAPLAAQVPPVPQPGAPPLRFSGQLGSFGQLYRRQGAPGRRPGETGRLYLNASAVLFGSVTLGVDLMATTEDGTTAGYGGLPGRQSIGQFGLHPRWKWGRAHLGAFSDSYSPFTYNGVQLRGAAFDFHPGGLMLGAFGGQAASAVAEGATTGAYRRTIAGGHLGYGRQAFGLPSTFVELTAMRVWDDPNSLQAVDTTLPPNAPVAGGTVPVNPYAVTPQQNLVASAASGLTFLKGLLAWRGELAGAIHTRDVRAPKLANAQADVPGLLRGLITPRIGTHADYALSSTLQLRAVRLPGATARAPRTLTAGLQFRYVGPGYTSLGVASLPNDVRALDARASLRFPRWTASLQGGRQNDNLIGQKLTTTTRSRLGGTLALRLTRVWNASIRANLVTMGNGSTDTLQWMDYRSWSIGTGHSFALGPGHRVESLTLDVNYSHAGDANPRRSSTDFASLSTNARLAIRLGTAAQVSPALGFTRSRSDTLAPVTRATYGLSAAWRLWSGRVTTTGSISRSRFSRSNTWTGSFSAQVRVTPQDALVLNAQFNRYRDTAAPVNWYNEQILTCRWERRF
jgi:hypothetical protein